MQDFLFTIKIEVPHEILIKRNLKDIKILFNSDVQRAKMLHLKYNGKIIAERFGNLIMANGIDIKTNTGWANFSASLRKKITYKELERLISIVNVLGNDKIIKEKISTFLANKSQLCLLPELIDYYDSFTYLNKLLPGFASNSFYYMPGYDARWFISGGKETI